MFKGTRNFIINSLRNSVFRQRNLRPRKAGRLASGCAGNYLIINPEPKTSSLNLKLDLLSMTPEYPR